MMRKDFHTYFFQLFFMLGLIFVFGAEQARALTVENVRFGIHLDKTRMVLDLDRSSKFRVFVLDNPYRLVVDLPDFQWHADTISKPVTSGVKAIRQGNLQPGISRIVVDLTQPMTVKNAFILRANQGKPNRLVIDFIKTDRNAFLQNKDKIHGILDVNATASTNTASTKPPPPKPVTQQKPPTTPPIQQKELKQTSASGMTLPGHKPSVVKTPLRQSKPLIIIDPGHGGIDPGAIGANGVFEKHIALAASQELKRMLEATGRYKVKLTRDKDIYLKLYQRVDIARKHGADLFISVHADSIRKSNVRGASIYTLSNKASDKQTELLAARENKADLIAGIDLQHEDEQVADILVDLTRRDTMNQSRFFANTIVKQMSRDAVRLLEKPHRYAGFAVLKAPDIPSVLIELGFLSNAQEARLLSQSTHRQKIISSIVFGIDAYFDKVRENEKT